MTPPRHLLDTHVLLWMFTDPGKLSATARRHVARRSAELVVSAAAAWEIATKYRLGRLPGAEPLVQGYRQHLERLGVVSLSITDEHSLLAGSLDWSHRDPFDRIIAAQSMIESLPVVTSDRALVAFPGVRTVW